MESLIAKYGYLMIAVGTFLEGEIILIWGGLWAQMGRLSLPLVMLFAYTGTVLGEFSLYCLGRWRGRWLFERFAPFRRILPRLERFAQRYGVWGIFIGRYFYTVRSVGNVFYGMSRMPWWTFIWATLLSCAIWTAAVATAGYLFGQAVALVLDEIKRYEGFLLAGILAVFLAAWLFRRLERGRIARLRDIP
jgi:membrane protein DedA with SNARE-associated domain